MYRCSSIAVVLLYLASCRVALAESEDHSEGAPHRHHHRHHHHHLHRQEAVTVPATQSLVATKAGDVASQAAAGQETPAAIVVAGSGGAAQPDAAAPSSQVYQVVKASPATAVCICQRGMPPPPPTCQMTCPTDDAQQGPNPICICQPGMPTPPPPCDAQCPGPKVEVYVAQQGNESKAFAVEAPEEETDKPLPAPKGPYMDVDLEMPYGHLEPFGREDTAQELTEQSMMESDAMVDQLEKAEVAEEKRAVFRALTRLRGAAIASFDGIARSQTGNIDQYAKVNKWREAHPVHHLASEEADVYKWAFPDKSD